MEVPTERLIDTLVNMFKDVMNVDAICAVVESCSGDLNRSIDVIMEITNESGTSVSSTQNTPVSSNEQVQTSETLSYANASRSTGAIPKQIQKPKSTSKDLIWSDQVRRILSHHNAADRIAIIMRGVPGSGKSYMARQLTEMMIGNSSENYRTHIFSTDDYFIIGGIYRYDKFRLSEAHDWNKSRVRAAMNIGLSPVIIDNTNIELWEMEPYCQEAVKNGYIIEIMEANTPWAKKVSQLSRRNTHNVPMIKIKKMLENYQEGISGEFLLRYFGLSYLPHMKPPVKEKVPITPNENSLQPEDSLLPMVNNSDYKNVMGCSVPILTYTESTSILNQQCDSTERQKITYTALDSSVCNNTVEHCKELTNCISLSTENETCIENSVAVVDNKEVEEEVIAEDLEKQKKYLEVQKQLEEIEKVEQEWENGENWGDETKQTVLSESEKVSLVPKPPRSYVEKDKSGKLLNSDINCEDWTQVSMFMTPWNDNSLPHTTNKLPEKTVEKISNGTCMEVGDGNIVTVSDKYKIVSATPRDINLSYISKDTRKIPEQQMLDKSSMTNEQSIINNFRCKNEEKHFHAFRKLFRNIAKPVLRDIFDNCYGDVNWAVDLVLDGMVNHQLETIKSEEVSDEETDNNELCDCLAAYNIIPDMDHTVDTKLLTDMPQNIEVITHFGKKVKKEKITTESSIQLKRQIEHNVVIPDNHYSDHCLKIRKLRRGEFDVRQNIMAANSEELEENNQDVVKQEEASENEVETDSTDMSFGDVDKSDDNDFTNDSIESMVTVNLGSEFMSQLDEFFGRQDIVYPAYIKPTISMPISLLNEINALWMESLMHQLDEEAKNSALMLQQDEEFARQLAIKEAELAQAGREPEVPDFKEIMDMDLALSIYQKDIEEWRNKEPTDLAAKLTREKLYNLFPDVSQEILSELLMAHDNNFLETVEVLLLTTGKSEILEEKNGINKYIMEKEIQRQEKILKEEEQKLVLSESEWPSLAEGGEKIEMTTVNGFREQAEKHLQRRNMNYQKAQEYISRGMTQVANYYSDIAAYHKKMYEQANSLAAVSLVHVNSANCQNNATIDLHFLRVGEAKESLDLFLDKHITKLKESTIGPRYHTLYFITGRGLHSTGGPRIKPAVKRRLRERGLYYCERNPGLLTTKVRAQDKLTYQVT